MFQTEYIKQVLQASKAFDYIKLNQLLKEYPEYFEAWLFDAIKTGTTYDDEYYAYIKQNELAQALGSHMSLLAHSLQTAEDIKLVNISGEFPMYAESFWYDNVRYWLITMIGQGACSWIVTEDYFNKKLAKDFKKDEDR